MKITLQTLGSILAIRSHKNTYRVARLPSNDELVRVIYNGFETLVARDPKPGSTDSETNLRLILQHQTAAPRLTSLDLFNQTLQLLVFLPKSLVLVSDGRNLVSSPGP